jgi:arsenate reductase
MTAVTIYHNPRCSKSRGALELLERRGVAPKVVEYLETPPGRRDLERLLALLPGPPAALVRRDDRFRELGLADADCASPAAVVELLLRHPELMQRPVVVRGERAVIARPSQKLLELFEDAA